MRAIVLGLLLSTLAESCAQQAQLEDSLGDAGFSPTDEPAPDLRSGSLELLPDGGLALQARFASGTFSAATTFVQFSIQCDEAEAVSDPCPRCGNYLVDINGVGGASRIAQVKRLAAESRYELAATIPIEFRADGVAIVFPASLMPSAVERVSVRVVTCVRLRKDALSVILDRMPEAAHPPAMLEVGRGRRTKS